jgi:predicted N-acetyltransferase YhbS
MSGEIEYREYRDQDFESLHALHDAVFPPVSAEQMRRWMARTDVTAGVAVRAGEVLGEIPLHIREFVLRPGVTARLAFEHSVCVREDLRDQGIGSGIHDNMKQFLPGRAEVLAVFRGGERTPGYRFYDRNGLKDTCYFRSCTLEEPARVPPGDCELRDLSELLEREAEVLGVFQSAFGERGGYEQRGPGFLRTALRNLQWLELRTRFGVYFLEGAGGLAGYCIVSPQQLRSDTVRIMELATRHGDQEGAQRLVRSACGLAAEKGVAITVSCQDFSLYWPVYRGLGFEPAPRGSMIMATPVDWEALAARVWQPQRELADVQVDIWTPDEELTVHRPEGEPDRTITLEMKHDQAVRWLLSRLDLPGAADREMLTCRGATPEDLGALGRAIPFCAWEVQTIDHI